MAKRRKGETELAYRIRQELERISRYVREKQSQGFGIQMPDVDIKRSWKSLAKAKQKYSAKNLRKQMEYTDPRTGVKYKGTKALRQKREVSMEREDILRQRIQNHKDMVYNEYASRKRTNGGFFTVYFDYIDRMVAQYGLRAVANGLEIVESNMFVPPSVAYDDYPMIAVPQYFSSIEGVFGQLAEGKENVNIQTEEELEEQEWEVIQEKFAKYK